MAAAPGDRHHREQKITQLSAHRIQRDYKMSLLEGFVLNMNGCAKHVVLFTSPSYSVICYHWKNRNSPILEDLVGLC